jgi:hypothetical protein
VALAAHNWPARQSKALSLTGPMIGVDGATLWNDALEFVTKEAKWRRL